MFPRFITLLFFAIFFSATGALNAQTLTTTAATNVTDLTATLNGTANANGGSYSLTFDYGTTTSYGATATATPSPISGSSTVTVTGSTGSPSSGLQPNTTYHFRLRTSTGVNGADMIFTTGAPATPPTVNGVVNAFTTTSNATTVSPTSVFAGSSTTSVAFEYGLDANYGSVIAAGTVSTASTGFPSANLTGLTPSTTYHVRCKAINGEGTVYSPDATFTTKAAPVIITTAATGVTDLAATLNGTANGNGGFLSMSFEYGLTTAYGSTASASPGTSSGSSTTTHTGTPVGLLASTTYHYRLRGQDSAGGPNYGNDMTFTTAPGATPPTVTTQGATAVSSTKATLRAATVFSGSSPTTLVFEYGPTTSYGSQINYPSVLSANTNSSNLSVSLTGLTPGTAYHFRAKATNNEGTGYGTDFTFTTLMPTLATTAATGLTDLAATLNGTANAGGGSLTLSFDYGLTTAYGSNMSGAPNALSGGTSPTAVTASPPGLLPSTTYHYRIKGTDGGGTDYFGSDMTFTTGAAATPPTVTTSAATNISATSATVTGLVFSGSSPTTLTFDYGTTTDYGAQMIFDTVLATNTTSSGRSVTLAGLTPGTTYHFRARATNHEGSGLSVDRTFTTLPAPVITTAAASSVTDVGATLNGSVNAGGGFVTLVFEYGPTTSYGTLVTTSPSSSSGSTAVAVSAAPTGLVAGATYHYRLRGSENGVFYYGDDATFTMAPPATPPTVTTGAATSMGITSATLVASNIFSGSSAAVVSFDCGTTTAYGKTANYSTVVAVNSSLSSASVFVSGLQPGTLYHFRARATNNEGVAYGADATFSTPAVPVVVTNSATGVTDLSATFNGTVDPGGGSLSVSFVYGTTPLYGFSAIPSPSSVNGTGAMAISANSSGLLAGTTYHYRFRASDSSGGIYQGNDMTFTTAPAASPPAWTTAGQNVLGTSAGISITGFKSGSSTATVAIEYGTNTGYGMEVDYPDTIAANTSTSLSTITLAGLTPGTLYHFRVRASNHEGTVYGTDSTFTTMPAPTVNTEAPTGVTDIQATLNGLVNANSTIFYSVSFEYGTSTAYGSSATPIPSSINGTSLTSTSVSVGLQPATTYHYRLKLTDGVDAFYGGDGTFTTNPPATPPSANTVSANQITATTAYLRAANVTAGSSPVTVSFLYGTTPTYGMTAVFTAQPISHGWGQVSEAITGLQPSTAYHFAVTAGNNEGSVTGSDLVFTTADSAVVATAAASNISSTSAILNGSVNPKGVASTFRFEYGLSIAYGSSTTPAAVSGIATLGRTATLGSLQPLTAYHYRARLDNVDGTFYGDDATFTTGTASSGAGISSVSRDTISANSVVLHANGVVAGDSTATVVFEYGPTPSYGTEVAYPATIAPGTKTGATVTVADLQPGTLYHYRAKVTNNEGVVYSADDTFLMMRLPVVHTFAATGVTDISAVLNGSSDAGGDAVTCAFEYGTTITYGTTVFVNTLSSNGESPLSTTLNELLPSTTYHYHLYLTADGYIYDGGDMTFTTGPAVSLPHVTTDRPGVGFSTATLGATSVSAGGSPATLSWDYGTDTSYGSTVDYPFVLTIGSFNFSLSGQITGLVSGASYHCRAKITNSFGTVYGDDIVFTTNTAAIRATTRAATLVSSTGATLNGSYSSNDNSTVITFDYGLDTNYGTSVPAVKSNPFASAVLSGLLPNTTYHFRAVNQTASNGTAYGVDMTFTTLDDQAPAVITGTATGTSGTGTGTAIFRGTVNPKGRPTIVGFEYGTSSFYGAVITTLPAAISGNSDFPVTVTAISLTNGASYHYRIVAMNDHGISYGADATVQVSTPPTLFSSQSSLSGPNTVILFGSSLNGTSSYFELGTSPDYGTVLTPAFGSSSVTVSSLQFNTTYHFHYVASNSSGYTYGDDVTFTTDFPSPTASYLPETGISANSATMNVTVTESGGADLLVCDFGIFGGYGNASLMNPSVASGTGASPASVTLTGLKPGTVYHYRLRAQRTLGNGTSSRSFTDRSFTTLTLAEDWRRIHFGSTANSGDAADTANPSGDGINNLMKYALGLDPNVPTSSVPQGVVKTYGPDQYLGFTFGRDPAKTDVIYEAQVADSPAGPWTTIASSAGGAVTSGEGFVGESAGPGGTVNVEVHDTVPMSSAGRHFIRLQVTR